MKVHGRLEVLAKAEHSYHIKGRILRVKSLSSPCLSEAISLFNMLDLPCLPQNAASLVNTTQVYIRWYVCLLAKCSGSQHNRQPSSADEGQAGCLHCRIDV